jgi:CDP-glucose 4,6-dehydratase
MEGLGMNPSFWKDKTVFLTGHTGFKGGWIAHWLYELGAAVHGYSLEPPTQPNFFTETQLQKRLVQSTIGDIRDLAALTSALKAAKPDIIIHMAAQPLVRESYKTPVETFAANVMGTVNLLEAARQVGTAKAIVNITTDKCYENKEWLWPYRENDRLGGHDPYSASKACAEIAAAAYRNSFLEDANIHLASVRAGNVIGGGDWATDRLIPDFLRALDAGKMLTIRSPNAIRPWQHVFEPLSGYLMLAEKLYTEGSAFAEAWNFGPNDEDSKPVSWIVDQLCAHAPGAKWQIENTQQPHEAILLKLDSSKAKAKLGWAPRWNLEMALSKTIEWHLVWREMKNVSQVCSDHISEYSILN